MNIVFMGTPDFALETLKQIHNSGHNILAVVCQPDKQVGRGMKVQMPPTKEYAINNDIEVIQPNKIRNNEEFFEKIKSLKPDIIVVVAYGKILPQEILDIPKYGSMNVHGSLLPKYRGAAPIQWAIINGESVTGVTTMKMDAGMDTGDIYHTAEVPIEKDDTYGTLYEKLKILGAKLAVKTLDDILDGTIKAKKQPEEFSTAPMIFKEDTKIDFYKSAYSAVNLIRGANPAPGAWFNYEDKVFKVWKAEEVSDEYFDKSELGLEPGSVVVSNSKEGLMIITSSGVLSILEIQAPNSKRMNILDYLRGNEIKVGSKLN